MTEDRKREARAALERDLQTYRDETARDLPTLTDTARALQARALGTVPPHIEEGFWMKTRRISSARPGLAAAAAVAIVAAILGLVPISYERTTGQEVTLTLTRTGLDGQWLGKLAAELKSALGAREVHVAAAGESPGTSALVAEVPGRRRADVERTANAFASALGAKGIAARARVAPRTQRVSSNVYALAMERMVEIRVQGAGRSAAEIETDIRSQLGAAGIENPEVHVTKEGDQTQVQIRAHSSSPTEGEHELRVELQGADSLNATVHRFEVKRTPGMTDADVKAEIERQMREAGVEGEVTVQNGEVHVEVHKRQ